LLSRSSLPLISTSIAQRRSGMRAPSARRNDADFAVLVDHARRASACRPDIRLRKTVTAQGASRARQPQHFLPSAVGCRRLERCPRGESLRGRNCFVFRPDQPNELALLPEPKRPAPTSSSIFSCGFWLAIQRKSFRATRLEDPEQLVELVLRTRQGKSSSASITDERLRIAHQLVNCVSRCFWASRTRQRDAVHQPHAGVRCISYCAVERRISRSNRGVADLLAKRWVLLFQKVRGRPITAGENQRKNSRLDLTLQYSTSYHRK